jgi:hypothetical protein
MSSLWYNTKESETPEEIYAYIIAAYHLRQDDAYAAVGSCRGSFKRSLPEFANDPWCEPAKDVRRFIARGFANGALPHWWSEQHTEAVLKARSMIGGTIDSAEEPADFIKNFGPVEGATLVAFLRDIGDLFEGKAPWNRSTDRDAHASRTPLIGRRANDMLSCERCRAGDEPSIEYLHRSCLYCGFSGNCPRCGGDIESDKKCAECQFRVEVYVLVPTALSPAASWQAAKWVARKGVEQPKLKWYAIGDRPCLCLENDFRRVKKASGVEIQADGTATSSKQPNVDDHLTDTQDPQMLILHEATRMFVLGTSFLLEAFVFCCWRAKACRARTKPFFGRGQSWLLTLSSQTNSAPLEA